MTTRSRVAQAHGSPLCSWRPAQSSELHMVVNRFEGMLARGLGRTPYRSIMRNLKRPILAFMPCAFAIAVHAAETNISDQFYSAIRRDDAPAVQALLRSGADVNVKDSRGRTPL